MGVTDWDCDCSSAALCPSAPTLFQDLQVASRAQDMDTDTDTNMGMDMCNVPFLSCA